jgi:hypothetical protein
MHVERKQHVPNHPLNYQGQIHFSVYNLLSIFHSSHPLASALVYVHHVHFHDVPVWWLCLLLSLEDFSCFIEQEALDPCLHFSSGAG